MRRSIINFSTKYVGLLIVFFVFLVFAKPYLLDSKIPYPSSHLVSLMPPWNSVGELSVPIKNNAMPDVITQIFPWKHFTIQELKNGRIPLWNPFSFSGNPHLANYQSAVFSLSNLFFFLVPFVDAWTASILVQPILLGIGMYLFLRRLKISVYGSVIGSITGMFCGFMVVWMAYGTLSLAIAFLPWMLYSIDEFLQSRRFRYLLLLVGSTTFSLYSGHFQTSMYAIFLAEIYGMYRVLSTKRLRDGGLLGLSFILGVVLSLPQLIPTLLFYQESVRSSGTIVDKGIPFYYFITALIPDFFGNPVTRNDWMSFYAERASFIGIIPFVLSLSAIFYHRSKETIFFLMVAVFSFLLALDSPLQSLLAVSHIPVLSSSNPTRIIVLFSFSLSVLSALGFDVLLKLIKERKRKSIIQPIFSIMIFLTLIFIVISFGKIMPKEYVVIAVRNSFFPLLSFLFFVISIVVYFFSKNEKIRSVLLGLIILLVAFDSLRFAMKWMPTDEKSQLYQSLPILEALQKQRDEGRVFQALGGEVSVYYGLQNIEGYDSLFLRRYGEFIQSAKKGVLEKTERTTVRLDRDGAGAAKALDLLSVATIFHPVSFNNQAFAYPVWKDPVRYKQIYKDDRFELYRNTTSQPRVRLYYSFEVIPHKQERIKRFYSKEFDFRKAIILEKKPKMEIGEYGSGSARIIFESPTRVVIQATSSKPAILFLSDPFYSQWKATINNKSVEILPAFHAFRAVEVPEGVSHVEIFLPYIN